MKRTQRTGTRGSNKVKGGKRFLVLFMVKFLYIFIAMKEEREGRTVEAGEGRTME